MADFLLLTASDGCPRPLLSTCLFLLHVDQSFSNPSNGISHPLLIDYLPYVPGGMQQGMQSFFNYYFLLFATQSPPTRPHGQVFILTSERARKRVRKIRVAERGIVVGRKVGGRRGLPTASNANVKTGE